MVHEVTEEDYLDANDSKKDNYNQAQTIETNHRDEAGEILSRTVNIVDPENSKEFMTKQDKPKL